MGRRGGRAWLVLDHTDRLAGGDLLQQLMRAREDTGADLALLLIGQASWASGRYLHGTQPELPPGEVAFHAYRPDQLQRVRRVGCGPLIMGLPWQLGQNQRPVQGLACRWQRALCLLGMARVACGAYARLHKCAKLRALNTTFPPLMGPQILEHRRRLAAGDDGELPAFRQFLGAFVPAFCRASNNLLDLQVRGAGDGAWLAGCWCACAERTR